MVYAKRCSVFIVNASKHRNIFRHKKDKVKNVYSNARKFYDIANEIVRKAIIFLSKVYVRCKV